jgi:hypothetical protein
MGRKVIYEHPICHPDRPHYAKGKCRQCYMIVQSPKYYRKNRKAILEQKKEYAEENKEAISEQRKEYARENKDVIRNRGRKYKLWKLFRLTPEEWETILKYQGGVCAISGKPPVTRALAADHDHKTGRIRGALAMDMNRGLAFFRDDPALLRKAADYLENPPAIAALGREVYGLLGKAQLKKKMVYGPPKKVRKKT